MHPRIQNNKSSQQYGGRRVVSHKTAELIQSSKLVLAHDSTAINFAVLWRIPLIIITTNDIEKGMRYRSMQALTASLKIKRININNRYNKLDFHKISNMPIYQYENYLNSFIKTDGCRMTDINSFEIFINGLIKYSKLKRK